MGVQHEKLDGTWSYDYVTTQEQFIEEVYEIAFGDDAINRDYSMVEVLDLSLIHI